MAVPSLLFSQVPSVSSIPYDFTEEKKSLPHVSPLKNLESFLPILFYFMPFSEEAVALLHAKVKPSTCASDPFFLSPPSFLFPYLLAPSLRPTHILRSNLALKNSHLALKGLSHVSLSFP